MKTARKMMMVAGACALAAGCGQIDSGEAGFFTEWGEVTSRQCLDEGLHFYPAPGKDLVVYDIRNKIVKVKTPVFTKDVQGMEVEMSVTYNLVRDKVFSLGVMIKKGGKKEDGSLYDDKNDVNYRDVRPLARTQTSTIPQQTVKQAVQPPVQPSYGYAPQNPQPPMPQRPVAPMQQPQAMPNNAAGVYMQQQITHQNKQQGAPYQQPPMPQMQTFEQAAATATEDDIPF